jgi:uncharacterized protein
MAIYTLEQIQDYADRIAAEFHPEKIILFGSYANGTPNEDSDVDLMVIMPFEGKWHYQAAEIELKIRPIFPMDLLVRTPQKIKERLDLHDFFVEDIVNEGKVLYESRRRRVGAKGRRRLLLTDANKPFTKVAREALNLPPA